MAIDLKDKDAVLARVKAHLRLKQMTVSQLCIALGYTARVRDANRVKRSSYWQKIRAILDADKSLHSRQYEAETFDILYSLTPFKPSRLTAPGTEAFVSQVNSSQQILPKPTVMATASLKRTEALRAVLENLQEISRPTRRKVATLAKVAESWLYLPEAAKIKTEIDEAISAELRRRDQVKKNLVDAARTSRYLREAQAPCEIVSGPSAQMSVVVVEVDMDASKPFSLEQELATCLEAIDQLQSKMAALEVMLASRAAYRDALQIALEARRAIDGPVKPV